MGEIVLIQISKEELKEIIQLSIDNAFKKIQPEKEEGENNSLLKIDEISRILNVSKVTIHKWNKEGLIPFHRMSNRIFFKKAEILDSLRKIDL